MVAEQEHRPDVAMAVGAQPLHDFAGGWSAVDEVADEHQQHLAGRPAPKIIVDGIE